MFGFVKKLDNAIWKVAVVATFDRIQQEEL